MTTRAFSRVCGTGGTPAARPGGYYWSRSWVYGSLLGGAAAVLCFTAGAADDRTAAPALTDVAVTIRQQGYECGTATNIVRDMPESLGDPRTWIVQCDNGARIYRVSYDDDGRPVVERIGGK